MTRRGAALFGLLALVAAALAAATILQDTGPHDEGLLLAGARRISDGQWPYRDFWTNYPPGQFVLTAGLTKVFGPSLLAWRVLRVVLAGLISAFAYLLVRKRAPAWLALAAWLGVALAMAWPAGANPNPAALALVAGAFVLAADGRRVLLAGALCGLAAFFRIEIGLAGALGVALLARSWRPVGGAAGVAALSLLPFFVVAPGDMWRDMAGFVSIQGQQRLPFPVHYHGGLRPNKLLEFYFPLLLLVSTAVWTAVTARARRRWALAALPLVLVGVGYLLGRTDEFHLVPLSATVAVVVALSAAGQRARGPLLALLAILALIIVNGLDRRAAQILHPSATVAVPSVVADGVLTTASDAAALRRLIPAIHALVPPGDPLLVAPPRFDVVRTGDPLLYVLADRPNPTRYDVMQPGLVTTARVQREMVRDLARNPPRAVVRWLDPRGIATTANGSSRSSGGVHLLDRWLAARYGRPRRYGSYVLLRLSSPRS